MGVLLPGYGEQQVAKSGLLDIIEKDLLVMLPGGHDATGLEREALDENRVRETIRRLNGPGICVRRVIDVRCAQPAA